MCFHGYSKYNLTPNYNINRNINSDFPSPADILMKSPSDFEIRLQPIPHTYSMDETDFVNEKISVINNEPKSENKSAKSEMLSTSNTKLLGSKTSVFCCGESSEGKINKKIPHPGQAVKVVTDSLGGHTVLKSEVCTYSTKEGSNSAHFDGSTSCMKSSKSYEDIIKFIFTEHGIRVLSEKETVV